METLKDKAKEIVQKYSNIEVTILGCGEGNPCVITGKMGQIAAKECAKIAVQEIIKANPIVPLEYMLESEALDAANEFYNNVLKEIDNV